MLSYLLPPNRRHMPRPEEVCPYPHRRQSAEVLFTKLGDPGIRTRDSHNGVAERLSQRRQPSLCGFRCNLQGSLRSLGSNEGARFSNLEVHHIVPLPLAEYDDRGMISISCLPIIQCAMLSSPSKWTYRRRLQRGDAPLR